MITYERKEIENLVQHARELVDYLIDDEARKILWKDLLGCNKL